MQQQPQGAYPRFDQPGQPPAFSIPHNNPYAQQNQAYNPPPQYGMPGQQSDPNLPQEKDLQAQLAQAEVQEIDDQLSSGIYSCYYCWLFVVAFYSVMNILQGLGGMIMAFYYIILGLEAAAECAYAIIMINVLKKKNLEKAELGLKLAFAACGHMFACFMLQAFLLVRLYGTETVPYLLLAFILLGGYYGSVIALPAMKIKDLLERREAALAQNPNVSPYNVALPSPYNIQP